MIKKITGKVKFYLLKIRYIFQKKIIMPKKGNFPISLELDISKKSNTYIGEKCTFQKNISIRVRDEATFHCGENLGCNNGVIITCRKKIYIGNNVLLGPNVAIFDNDHDYYSKHLGTEYKTGEIYIGDNVWIGANSIILRGSKIEKNAVIAAGSIVKGEVKENTVFYNERVIKTKVYEKYEK